MKTTIKKLALTILLAGIAPILEPSFSSALGNTQSCHFAEAASSTVYYCTGPNAKKYHSSSSCKGLNKCSGKISKCTKAEAEKKGLTPCKICH